LKAIILAAGEGTRLHTLTQNTPKCLVKLFGKSLLEWQLSAFRDSGISKICVIKGHHGEKINFPNITYYTNEKYKTTNMVETLFCAKKEFNEPVIVSYGDIIFEKSVVRKLIQNNEDFSVIVDKDWEKYWRLRFINPLDDAESLKIDKFGYISEIGQKVKKIDEIEGQFTGLIKIQGDGLDIVKSLYDQFKKQAQKEGKNPLNQDIPFEKSYMTDFLQGLIEESQKLSPVFIKNGWLELDSMNDYQIYNQMYKNGTLSELINLENGN